MKVIADFDRDGIKDILVCGNSNDAAVMVGNYDAMAISLLKGDGKGGFETVPHTTDGLKVRGECRKMVYLPGSRQLVILKNSAAAQVYQQN
jgi:enediyne biosynthesis protein E4